MNKYIFRVARFGLIVIMAAVTFACIARAQEPVAARVTVAFNGSCENVLLAEIGKAQREILMAAYSITRHSIVNALGDAAQRGVRVRVKYDAKQAEYEGMSEAIDAMKKRRIRCTAVRMTGEYAAMHNKFAVFDRERVATGSYNFTTPASVTNYENLVLIDSPDAASRFAEAFDKIKSR